MTISNAGFTYESIVEGGASVEFALGKDECVGTAIVVKTEEGGSVGVVNQPACPGWELTIKSDRTLEYVDD